MMKQYFDNLVSGIESSLESDPQKASARKKYALEIARLGSKLFDENHSIAWCGVLAPFDILNAMGVSSCFIEFVGAMLASTGAASKFIEEAERQGYSTDSCAYHRAVIGAGLLDSMPEPDFIIATSAPCSGGLAAIENLGRMSGKDIFVLSVPNHSGPDAVTYLAEQIRGMVEFVGERTGRPLIEDDLRQAIDNTNKGRALLEEVYEMARRRPTPARVRDLENFGIVMALFLGTQAGVDLARAYRDEFAAKVEAGTGGVANERYRVMWIQNRIQFKNPLMKMIEEDFGAAVVADELNVINWDPIDPDDPYPGLARRIMAVPLVGPIERRVQLLKDMARKYEVDGAINPCHWGCRQGTGARGLIEKGLKDIGVGVLNLEVDCIDERNFAEGQLRTRLEAFFEMLG